MCRYCLPGAFTSVFLILLGTLLPALAHAQNYKLNERLPNEPAGRVTSYGVLSPVLPHEGCPTSGPEAGGSKNVTEERQSGVGMGEAPGIVVPRDRREAAAYEVRVQTDGVALQATDGAAWRSRDDCRCPRTDRSPRGAEG